MKRNYFYFLFGLILFLNLSNVQNRIKEKNLANLSRRLESSKVNNKKDPPQWNPYSLVKKINLYTGICDPENYLKEKSTLAEIVEKMNKKYKMKIFVILISEISSDYTDSKTKLKKTYSFLNELSKALTKKYTINDDNSLIILLSINDKQGNMRSGYLFRKYFKRKEIEKVLTNAESELQEKSYNLALEKILQNINKSLEEDRARLREYIIFILLLSLIIAIVVWLYKKNKRVKLSKQENNNHKQKKYKYKKMTVEQTLAKIENFNKTEKTSKELALKYCIICLEKCNRLSEDELKKGHENHDNDFDILKTEEVNYEPVTILNCGHLFHYDCIHYWMDEQIKECPTCKWKLEENRRSRGEDKGGKLLGSRKFNFLNGIIEVHSRINSDLSFYHLNIRDGEITWTLPSIEEDENDDDSALEKVEIEIQNNQINQNNHEKQDKQDKI